MGSAVLKKIKAQTPALTAAAMLIGFFALWQYQSSREESYLKRRISDEAKRVELEVVETIKQTSQALERYAARVELLGTKNKTFLELDSSAYLSQLPILKRIGLIDSSNHVYWSYPYELSGQVQGFDQGKDPRRLAALTQARETRTTALSQAIELKSGGTGFLLPIAIFPKGEFAGFVYATVGADKLFHSFVPVSDFQVSILEDKRLIFQSTVKGSLVSELKQSHEVKWARSSWVLQITPTEKIVSESKSSWPAWILAFGIALSLLVGALLQGISRSRRIAIANSDWRNALIGSADYAIISTDADGVIRTFNNAATKMLGYQPDDLIGKHTPKIFHIKEETEARAKVLTAELGRTVVPGFDTFTAKARALRIADENEWTFVRKDQSTFPASLSVTAIFNLSGEVSGYLGICLDLTEKKKAQELLAVTGERLKRVVEATQEGIWEREYIPNGEIKFIDSQAKIMFGFEDKADPTYSDVVSVFVADDMARTAEALRSHVENKTPGFDLEMRIRNVTGDSKQRWIRARGKVIAVPSGVPLLVSTVKDVTQEVEKREELKSALATAEEATKAKSEFLANMSHEIRTPLHGVIGMTDLLLNLQLGVKEREYAETIRGSAELLLGLINDILDFSKIEARKLDFEIVDFNFDQVVQGIERLLQLSAERKGIQLSRNLAPELQTAIFKGDPNRIGQILANLVGNAVKFTQAGRVSVNVTCESNTLANRGKEVLRVEVTDTGIGMSEEVVNRMFQPFSQADSSTSRRFGGTGLGLSICKHLAEMMGGEIGVTSQEGVGSTFWFTLALEKSERSSLNRNSAKREAATPNSLDGVRILLAEDNPVNQVIARAMLEKFGASVGVATNGNEVLEALRTAEFDLILMDCQMPELDGYQTTTKIRLDADSKISSIPIIAMTANAMAGDREKCLEVGMNDYVTKPVKSEVLVETLARALGASGGFNAKVTG